MTSPQTTTASFQIDGMTCMGCAGRIEKALRASLPDLEPAFAIATKRLDATFDPARVSVPEIVRIIGEAGYEAVPV